MRKQYESILRAVYRRNLLDYRSKLGISQEEMACRLSMACRSYVELEHGRNGCSALTLVLFLLRVCDKPFQFLEDLRRAFNDCDQKAA